MFSKHFCVGSCGIPCLISDLFLNTISPHLFSTLFSSDGDFVDVVTEDERAKIELQFERTLGEYDDDEIGELEDVSGMFILLLMSCYLLFIWCRCIAKQTTI